jgi:hypothetical protein
MEMPIFKILGYAFGLLLIIVVFRFYVGTFSHDDFGGKHIFIKHRPIWKWHFVSPIGMSDLKMEDLPPEWQEEQQLFEEFIHGQGLSY